MKQSSDIPFNPAQLSFFEVDPIMGFMASHPPPTRLPAIWEIWEAVLDNAVQRKIQLGDKIGLSDEDKKLSHTWRQSVKRLPVLPIDNLKTSKPLLRRAHLVLSYIQHFYLQSLPLDQPTILPRSISLPLLRVSAILQIPPLLTYSDTVLYNWRVESSRITPTSTSTSAYTSAYTSTCPSTSVRWKPVLNQLRSQTMFTNTIDEEEFYLCSARIELRGVEALEVMRIIMDEIFVGDDIAVRRTAVYLAKLSSVIDDLKSLLEDVKKRCDPDRYFNDVRPWFRGEDSDSVGYSPSSDTDSSHGEETPRRKWIFEGIEEDPELEEPKELSGPSAGQSSIIHVLDLFLGIDHESHTSSPSPAQPSFMTRMKTYMPYHHRMFINHLASYPRPLRSFVAESNNEELKTAYNKAVMALKRFRDAHMIIAALYILGPSRRAREKAKSISETSVMPEVPTGRASGAEKQLKGTGGTDLVNFLKDTRTKTVDTVLPD